MRRAATGAAGMLAAILLAACGFHLKETSTLAPAYRNLHFSFPDGFSDLHGALATALVEAGATMRAQEANGPVLELVRDEPGRRVLSVSVRNVPTEYEIFYDATYRVTLDGKEVLPATGLSASRIIAYTESAQLAEEHEELIVREALARDLAERIVRRLAAL